MAPKKSAGAAVAAPTASNPSTQTTPATPSTAPSTTTTSSSRTSATKISGNASLADSQKVFVDIWNNYIDKTPQRAKLIDAFMVFLMLVGAVQFAYCLLAGNYPFNAFLSGFSATVGQFVLTASLRIQTNPVNEKEFAAISHERAFADFVFGSMILHFFCVNFIN